MLPCVNCDSHTARRVYAFASHGIFSGPANDRILRSSLHEVVVANTIPLTESTAANPKIIQVHLKNFESEFTNTDMT